MIEDTPGYREIMRMTPDNKRNVLSGVIECLTAFKFYQTRPNTIKQHQKQGGQTVKCLVAKQCLMVFGRQTFPVWTGLHSVFLNSPNTGIQSGGM